MLSGSLGVYPSSLLRSWSFRKHLRLLRHSPDISPIVLRASACLRRRLKCEIVVQNLHVTHLFTTLSCRNSLPIPAASSTTSTSLRVSSGGLASGGSQPTHSDYRRSTESYSSKMLVTLSFVTTPTVDTRGTCLVLHAANQRYMIGNLHEGVQRALAERAFRYTGLSEIFLTGITEWTKIGGLMGWILSISDSLKMTADQHKSRVQQAKMHLEAMDKTNATDRPRNLAHCEPEMQTLNLHGGPNLAHMIATGRRFIFRKGHPINVYERDETTDSGNQDLTPTWKNEQISVWAMPVAPFYNSGEGHGRQVEQQSNSTSDSEHSHDAAARKGILQSVISNMFDSDWRMDDLAEMSLKDVILPAAIFVRDPKTNRLEQYSKFNKVPERAAERPDVSVLVRRPWPGALVANLPPTQPHYTALSYIVKFARQRGKFLPKKAAELKVRYGGDFSKLARGESVVSEDGHTVLPEQVLAPSRPGRGIIFAEIPKASYLKEFLARRELLDKDIMEGVVIVIWILGRGVADEPAFQSFVNQQKDWKHIISSPDYNANYLAFRSAAENLVRHHIIDPQRFSLPKFDNTSQPLPPALAHCQLAARGLQIRLEPEFKIETDPTEAFLNTMNVVNTFPNEVRRLTADTEQELKQNARDGPKNEQLPGSENEIITLGTGSALPSKYRNVSATLLRVPGVGSYLLDCGENTLGQLARIYGPEELLEVLRDLKVIWISHMHADHHLGITSVIKAWYEAVHGGSLSISHNDIASKSTNAAEFSSLLQQQGKLFVISEAAMVEWLSEYAAVENYGFDQLIPLEVFSGLKDGAYHTFLKWRGNNVGFRGVSPEVIAAMQTATGLADLSVCSVPHCHGARGVAFSFPDGFKLSYSGDSRPSHQLAEIGKDSTVLLHEATFDDEMSVDAKAKGHSTTSEAIGVGVAMGAKRIVLTHFSQRYSKIPIMSDLREKTIVLEETDTTNQDMTVGTDEAGPAPTLAEQDPVRRSLLGDYTSELSQMPVETSILQQPETRIVPPKEPGSQLKVAVAFDCMRVRVKDIHLLEKFAPAFVELYKHANDRLNRSETDKAEKQARSRETRALEKEQRKKKRQE